VHSADSTVEFAAIGTFFWIHRESKSLFESQAIIKRSFNCWMQCVRSQMGQEVGKSRHSWNGFVHRTQQV